MFVVRAIQDKRLQEEICSILKTDYIDNSLAFFAADLKDNGTDIDKYISVCQFYLGKNGEIVSFTAADGRENDEAVIVMLRTVMNFMYRCGVKTACFLEGSTNEWWLKKSGFVIENGIYMMDLEKFYTSPCKYSEVE